MLKMEVEIKFKQLVLPYIDPIHSEKHGWQFGLPKPTNLTGLRRTIATQSDCSVLILHQNGTTTLQPHPIYTELDAAALQPPLPIWGWVAFDVDTEDYQYARVVAPRYEAGSVPLSNLQWRSSHEFPQEFRGSVTPYGAMEYNLAIEQCDFQDDLQVAHNYLAANPDADNISMLQLADIDILRITQRNGYITMIEPTDWAIENNLWTSHLFRLVHVFCTE